MFQQSEPRRALRAGVRVGYARRGVWWHRGSWVEEWLNVHPGSIKTLYRLRRVGQLLLWGSPLLLLLGLYLLVTLVLLRPGLPGPEAEPEQVVQFIAHKQGLPRLKPPEVERFLEGQIQRLLRDEAYRDGFLREVRTASIEDQEAFRSHLFDAIKPTVMADIRAFHALLPAERLNLLDERIVAYNRLARVAGGAGISKDALGQTAPNPQQMLDLLMRKTTDEERQLGLAYLQALQLRVLTILADPDLKAEFEARIADPG